LGIKGQLDPEEQRTARKFAIRQKRELALISSRSGEGGIWKGERIFKSSYNGGLVNPRGNGKTPKTVEEIESGHHSSGKGHLAVSDLSRAKLDMVFQKKSGTRKGRGRAASREFVLTHMSSPCGSGEGRDQDIQKQRDSTQDKKGLKAKNRTT